MTAISPLLQDADRKLSKALADTPGARLHATEAAAAIAAGTATDPRLALVLRDDDALTAWTEKARALAMNLRHRAYDCGSSDAGTFVPGADARLASAWAAHEAHLAALPEVLR